MNDWPLAQRRIRLAPSILSADFARLADAVACIEAAGAEILHLDIMDGHFVPNLSYGVPVIESLRRVSKLFFDAHLMITDPMKYAEPFVKSGANLLTFHAEVTDEPRRVIEHIRSLGAFVGISINPDTPVDAIASVVADVDLVLVMSVWPGFGGQKFIPKALDKLRQLKEMLRPEQRLEIDGGIATDTIAECARAGADMFVAGSAIFNQPDPAAAMHELSRLAREATTQS